MNKSSLKIYQVSFKEKVKYVLRNYDETISMKKNIEETKFYSLDELADRIMYHHEKNNDDNQDFLFTINIKQELENELKEYLIKNKEFFLDYIVFKTEFISTHLYQLYLEYIPYELTEIEKSILLDGYIKLVTYLRGKNRANEKRIRLEKRLNLNTD